MKKLVTLVLAVFLIAGTMNAQLRLGLKGGANISGLSTTSNLISDVKSASAYQMGLMLQLKFGGFAIQPELLYSMKGGDLRNVAESPKLSDLTNNVATLDYESQNIEIPVNFQFGLEVGPARVYAQAGPYVSFLLGGALNGDVKLYKTVNETLEFNKYDWGYGFGAGAELFGLQLAIKYDMGQATVGKQIKNFADPNINPFFNMKNRNLNISLGYLF